MIRPVLTGALTAVSWHTLDQHHLLTPALLFVCPLAGLYGIGHWKRHQ